MFATKLYRGKAVERIVVVDINISDVSWDSVTRVVAVQIQTIQGKEIREVNGNHSIVK